MTLAAKPARRQRDKSAGAILPPRPLDLLAWYDRHRRKLPWRAPPGERADPYRVWLSEIMLQQTTVKAVGPYYARFLVRWPDIRALAAAPLDDVLKTWAGLGKELLTSSDHYTVTFTGPVSSDIRTMIVMVPIVLDMTRHGPY